MLRLEIQAKSSLLQTRLENSKVWESYDAHCAGGFFLDVATEDRKDKDRTCVLPDSGAGDTAHRNIRTHNGSPEDQGFGERLLQHDTHVP
jgi:hypothetical protein